MKTDRARQRGDKGRETVVWSTHHDPVDYNVTLSTLDGVFPRRLVRSPDKCCCFLSLFTHLQSAVNRISSRLVKKCSSVRYPTQPLVSRPKQKPIVGLHSLEQLLHRERGSDLAPYRWKSNVVLWRHVWVQPARRRQAQAPAPGSSQWKRGNRSQVVTYRLHRADTTWRMPRLKQWIPVRSAS